MPIGHGYIAKKDRAEHTNHDDPVQIKAFSNQFDQTSTFDFSPILAISDAILYRESLGGEEAIIKHNRDLAQAGGQIVARALGTEVMQAEAICMVNIRLP